MTVSAFPTAPLDFGGGDRDWTRQIARVVSNLMRGKSNNVLDVTVATSAAVTTVSDARIGVNTFPLCLPTNAHAAAITMPYVADSSRVNGSFILAHANDGNTKTFKVVLFG